MKANINSQATATEKGAMKNLILPPSAPNLTHTGCPKNALHQAPEAHLPHGYQTLALCPPVQLNVYRAFAAIHKAIFSFPKCFIIEPGPSLCSLLRQTRPQDPKPEAHKFGTIKGAHKLGPVKATLNLHMLNTTPLSILTSAKPSNRAKSDTPSNRAMCTTPSSKATCTTPSSKPTSTMSPAAKSPASSRPILPCLAPSPRPSGSRGSINRGDLNRQGAISKPPQLHDLAPQFGPLAIDYHATGINALTLPKAVLFDQVVPKANLLNGIAPTSQQVTRTTPLEELKPPLSSKFLRQSCKPSWTWKEISVGKSAGFPTLPSDSHPKLVRAGCTVSQHSSLAQCQVVSFVCFEC